MTEGELILYTAEDGKVEIQLRAVDGTVWITQAEMATLFQTTPQNITLHVKAIYAEGELLPEATCKEHLQVRQEAARQVKRSLKHYNLDMILAVGYRVRSLRGTQFRQWASNHLREYLIKDFVLDDARLKEPGGWDYFDEMLERIRHNEKLDSRFPPAFARVTGKDVAWLSFPHHLPRPPLMLRSFPLPSFPPPIGVEGRLHRESSSRLP